LIQLRRGARGVGRHRGCTDGLWKWFKNSPYSKLLRTVPAGARSRVRLLQSVEHPVLVSGFEKELRRKRVREVENKRKTYQKGVGVPGIARSLETLLIFCSK
jgi:hypothetical protein